MREGVLNQADLSLLNKFKEARPEEFAALSDAEALERLKAGRAEMDRLGIQSKTLRMRFLMLATYRFPEFWKEPELRRLLNSPRGSGDVCFEDACGAIRLAFQAQGHGDVIWW